MTDTGMEDVGIISVKAKKKKSNLEYAVNTKIYANSHEKAMTEKPNIQGEREGGGFSSVGRALDSW